MRFKKRREARPFVRMLDLDTGKITSIPAAELAPGMIRVMLEGQEGEFWVDAGKAKASPYRHPPFDEHTRDYLRYLQETLSEVDPVTLEEWEDGFRRDIDWERELTMWLYLAQHYLRLTENRQRSLGYKMDIYQVLLSCLNNPREQILTVVHLQEMTRNEAEEIIRVFFQETGTS
jgi:hypothetical protein